MHRKHVQKRLHPEAGMTMIELLIAGVVLVVGMLAIMVLLGLATGNNGRSKVDSTATMLSQAVVEQITAVLAGGGPGSIVDNNNCDGTGNTWTIDSTAGNPPNGAGAPLLGGKIDFTQAAPAGSKMDYVDCAGNVRTTYDVRWNVQTIGASGTFLVTVGARPKGGGPKQFTFALPVTMRVYVGGN
jgi:type II secretory pathway pseudopilin PulG